MCWASLLSLLCSSNWCIAGLTWCNGSIARLHLLRDIQVLDLKDAAFHHRWKAATKPTSSQHLSLISCTLSLHRSSVEVSLTRSQNTRGILGKELSCPNCWLSVVQPSHRAADVLLLSLMQSSLSTLNQTCLEYRCPGDSLSIPVRESRVEINHLGWKRPQDNQVQPLTDGHLIN